MQRPILNSLSVVWCIPEPSMMTLPTASSGHARNSQRESGVVFRAGTLIRSLMTYVPSCTRIRSPGLTISIALCMVSSGASKVPGLSSLPLVATWMSAAITIMGMKNITAIIKEAHLICLIKFIIFISYILRYSEEKELSL